jgi:PTS system fructose-specific IIA component/PTS system nitrogen regulatory IIA component
VPLEGRHREEVLAELVELQIRAGLLSRRDGVLDALLERESKGSTAIGCGLAVPHAKHPHVEGVAVGVGVSPSGIEFGAADGGPVHVVFLVLSGPQNPSLAVQVLAEIGNLVQAPDLCPRLVSARNADDLVKILQTAPV